VGAAVEFASDLAGIAREYDAIRERTSENGRRKTDHGPAGHRIRDRPAAGPATAGKTRTRPKREGVQ